MTTPCAVSVQVDNFDFDMQAPHETTFTCSGVVLYL